MEIGDGLDDLSADSPQLAEFDLAGRAYLFMRNHRGILSHGRHDEALDSTRAMVDLSRFAYTRRLGLGH